MRKIVILFVAGLIIFILSLWVAFSSSQRNGNIVFVSVKENPAGDLYIVNADGNGRVRLTSSTASEDMPSWSPDGKQIAFVSDRGNPKLYSDLFLVNIDDMNITRLTQNVVVDGRPIWSPDGKKIVFRGNNNIYTINMDGTELRQLTNGILEMNPKWSPDGSRIVFESKDSKDQVIGIYLINADGSNRRRLNPPQALGYAPDWSPDGRRIVFTSGREIYTVDVNDGKSVVIVPGPYFNFNPIWSPDGQKIAFLSSAGKAQPNGLYIMDPEGNSTSPLGEMDVEDFAFPSWSPDSKHIAFVSGPAIYIVNVDGSGLKRISDSNPYISPMWSPKR